MVRTSRTFRLFVSSTFRDFVHERTVLQRHVFPKLQELCERHGAKFQPIDLRWGITEEASVDHKTVDICLRELQRSIELSPRPNFLILSGNRYGWVPLPNTIEKQEFDSILDYYKEKEGEAYNKLIFWYKEDRNQVPAHYVLKSRTDEYLELEVWEKEEEVLRLVFQKAIEELDFPSDKKAKYKLSATEHEIQNGAFKQENADRHVFAFMRNIKGNVTNSNYVDLDEDGQKNKASEYKLKQLRKKIECHLPAENIHQYDVDWIENDIDLTYLSGFYNDVLARLTTVIEEELLDLGKVTELDYESKRHEIQGEKLAKSFIGRELWLENAVNYIEANQVTVIYGESGSGKSAAASVLANELKMNIPNRNRLIIQRYIGTTIFTQNTQSLLNTIELELIQGRRWDGQNQELDQILESIHKSVHNSSTDEVIIFLDAVDRLDDPYTLLKWFHQIPSNIKIVITVAEEQRAYKLLTNAIAHDTFIKMEDLSESDGEAILKARLAESNRTLQPKQKDVVMESIRKNPTPLFIKMAVEEVKTWKSSDYSKVLSGTLDDLLAAYFEKLVSSASQSSLFVEHALGLLASAKEGLTENELMEIITKDEGVMHEFNETSKHDYVGERLPVVLWARLHNEIEPFLVEKDQNGLRLYQFDHHKIQTFIGARYAKRSFHQLLADYFYNSQNFLDEARLLPNIRKAVELSYQLIKDENLTLLEKVLMDFDFGKLKFEVGLSSDFLGDFLLGMNLFIKKGLNINRISVFLNFYKNYHSMLVQYPYMVRAFALQNGMNTTVSKEAKRWYQEHGIVHLALQGRKVEQKSFHVFHTTENQVSACALHPTEPYAVIGVRGKAQVWDTRLGECIEEIYLASGDVLDIQFHNNMPYIGIMTADVLYVYRIQNGYGTLNFRLFNSEGAQQFTALRWHPEKLIFTAGNGSGVAIVCDLEKHLSEKIIADFQLKTDPILAITYTPIEGQVGIWYNNEDFILYDYEKVNQLTSFPTGITYDKDNVTKQNYDVCWLAEKHVITAVSTLNKHGPFVPPNNVSLWNSEKGYRENGTVSLGGGIHKIYDGRVYSALAEGVLQKWNPTTGEVEEEINLGNPIRPIGFDVHDGQYMILEDTGKVFIGEIVESLEDDDPIQKVEMTNDNLLWTWSPFIKNFIKDAMRPIFLAPKWKMLFRAGGNPILSKAISQEKQYVSKGFLDGIIEVGNELSGESMLIKPYKTNSILFQDWSLDETFVILGTKNRAWVLNIKTKLIDHTFNYKKYAVLDGKWSPVENKLALFYDNGIISIFNQKSTMIQEINLLADYGEIEYGQMVWNKDGSNMAVILNTQLFIVEIKKAIIIGKIALDETPLAFYWTNANELLILQLTSLVKYQQINGEWIQVMDVDTKTAAHSWYKKPVLYQELKRLEQKKFIEDNLWEQVHGSGWICPVDVGVIIIGQGNYLMAIDIEAPDNRFEFILPFIVGVHHWNAETKTLTLYNLKENKHIEIVVYIP